MKDWNWPKVAAFGIAAVVALSLLGVSTYLIAIGKGEALIGPLVAVLAAGLTAAVAIVQRMRGQLEPPPNVVSADVTYKDGRIASLRPRAPSLVDLAEQQKPPSTVPPPVSVDTSGLK